MKRFFSKSYSILFLSIAGLGLLTASCDDDPIPLRDPNGVVAPEFEYTWAKTADSLQLATTNTYLGSNGTYIQNNTGNSTFHYWPNAHVLDVLVDGYLRTGNESYIPKMKALLQGIKVKNGNTYNNVFNDDMLWLANSSLRAYDATKDAEYKEVADFLWERIKLSWSDVFGGGITWKQDTPMQKNAVSNGPAAILAMRLYEIDKDPEDLEWAKKIYAWQKKNLVDPVSGLVWDNISETNGVITTNKDWVFTYNMGTWIGAGLRLYKATNDQTYLDDAVKSGRSVLTSPKLVSEGILKDEGQGDGGLFKGILVRYFTELTQQETINSTDKEKFADFMKFNAETFYKKGILRPAMLSGNNWKVAPAAGANVDLTTQLSGVMLIEAAAKLDKDGYFD
ncbi:glycoside hydrolase family 76 protein [Flavobacterium sp. LC2016-12]|uniref:glycoside hydrolase family 76 protein n=1 Tax=Flavobacterium sp. LC2016-12 TaxID=2783794 RepID=UPI00188B761B|nr:glycoside hydrolase family 76 protein [Flavobacterium sp. LC2016-12]MBF4465014.1 glycosyl hydrolase family 76 [Flavobacterium sp. LC2016-12]